MTTRKPSVKRLARRPKPRRPRRQEPHRYPRRPSRTDATPVPGAGPLASSHEKSSITMKYARSHRELVRQSLARIHSVPGCRVADRRCTDPCTPCGHMCARGKRLWRTRACSSRWGNFSDSSRHRWSSTLPRTAYRCSMGLARRDGRRLTGSNHWCGRWCGSGDPREAEIVWSPRYRSYSIQIPSKLNSI